MATYIVLKYIPAMGGMERLTNAIAVDAIVRIQESREFAGAPTTTIIDLGDGGLITESSIQSILDAIATDATIAYVKERGLACAPPA